MNVRDAGNLLEEVSEVGMLGVTGKLSAAVLTNIDEPLDACLLEKSEKLLRRFSRETDRGE